MAKLVVNFVSCALRRNVDMTVVIPTLTICDANAYNENKITHKEYTGFPVLYLFHGYSGDHSSWSNLSSIVRYAEENLIAVVMISGENKFYQNLLPQDDYITFIQKELPDFITSHFPVSKKPQDTYIAGLSMGGYGAMLHGLLSPEKFGAIGSFSGAFGQEIYQKHKGIMVLEDILEENIKQGKKIPPIYMSIGGDDWLLKGNKEFEQTLSKKGIKHDFKITPGYSHEWAFWDIEVLNFIKCLPRIDKYKNKKNKV